MKNREHFFREDWKTMKVKFKLLCNKSEFSLKKFSELENKPYISRIKIITHDTTKI